jgi:hypothetical protein
MIGLLRKLVFPAADCQRMKRSAAQCSGPPDGKVEIGGKSPFFALVVAWFASRHEPMESARSRCESPKKTPAIIG